MTWPSHGSNPNYLYEAIGYPLPKTYLDFSANINPLGPPASLKEKWNEFFPKINVYPDPLTMGLKEKIAKKEQIDKDMILIGNGGAELITLIARMLSGKPVLILQPSFSEYQAACEINKCQTSFHQIDGPDWELKVEDLYPKLEKASAVFLCSPNNPTGVEFSKTSLIQLINFCMRVGCLVILDEAFYDFLEDYSSMIGELCHFSNLIILRSMTKMFSIPGIRLGYILAHPAVINSIKEFQPHWSVNTLALLAGEVCLEEELFVQQTQKYIADERNRLFQFYENHRFIHSPSKVNFYLLKDSQIQNQFPLFQFLLQNGVVPRHTFNFHGLDGDWLRFAVKSEDDNNRLLGALSEWRKHMS